MTEQIHRNALKPGYALHWYVIERVIGQGGFGITYLATDTNLGTQVAIKEYLPLELAVREGDDSVYPATSGFGDRFQWGLERFETEARTLARFRHPGIVRVMSVFEANNTAYMVMEYERGESLQEVLTRRKTMEEKELLAIVLPLLGGLRVIHEAGFVHRDVKPANIIIRPDGSPVLIDFGSARQALGQQTRTLTSVVSPGYAPYEQYYSKSDKQGPWTDIYGLGATLYRAISGRAPLDALGRSEAILKSERDLFVSAAEIGANRYSRRFLAAIDHALRFRENERPQSVAAWADELGWEDEADIETVAAPGSEWPGEADDDDPRTVFELRPRVARAAPAPARRGPPATASRARRRIAALAGVLGVVAVLGALWPVLRDVRPGAVLQPAADAVSALVQAIGDAAAPREPTAAEQVAALLAQAREAAAGGRLLEPAGESAVERWLEILALDPGQAEALAGLGQAAGTLATTALAAAAQGNFTQADAELARAQALAPDGVEVSVRSDIERLRAAAAAATQRRDALDGHLAAAEAARGAGRYAGNDSAFAHYEAALALAPEDARARAGIDALFDEALAAADRALGAGDAEAASGVLGQAAALRPDDPALAPRRIRLERVAAAGAAAADRERIDALLARGDAALAALRLTSPPGDNAVEAYRAALRIAPDNAAARAGLLKVADRYVALAQRSLDAGDLDAAEGHVAAARRVAPDAGNVRLVADALATAQLGHETQARARAEAAEARHAEEERAAQARRQLEEQEARQLAELNRRRDAERLLQEVRAQAQADRQAAAARVPVIVVSYADFGSEFVQAGLRVEEVRNRVEARLRHAGYQVVSGPPPAEAENARLMDLAFRANLNTTTGTYSSSVAVAVREQVRREDGSVTFAAQPAWKNGEGGVLRGSEMHRVYDLFDALVARYVSERPPPRP